MPPDRIAQIDRCEALVMIGPDWEIVPTLPYHQRPTFAPIAASARVSAAVGAGLNVDGRLLQEPEP